MLSNDTLSGKRVLITGGGSGLGFSMAKRFLELGARVAICGRNAERLEEARRTLGWSSALETVVCDVRDYEAVGTMFNELGAVDALVNNAAGNFLSASEDLSPNAFKSVIDIVLHGTFNCTQHFGRQLIAAAKPGAVLSIVTTYAQTGSAFVLPSACAKAGVYALTKSLAFEWATYGIRLNAIAPGPFPTAGAWSRLVPDSSVEDAFRRRVPLGRFGTHGELADLAAFVLSDMAAFMTGECVTLDGGEQLTSGQFNFIADLMPRDKLRALFQSMKPPARER